MKYYKVIGTTGFAGFDSEGIATAVNDEGEQQLIFEAENIMYEYGMEYEEDEGFQIDIKMEEITEEEYNKELEEFYTGYTKDFDSKGNTLILPVG